MTQQHTSKTLHFSIDANVAQEDFFFRSIVREGRSLIVFRKYNLILDEKKLPDR